MSPSYISVCETDTLASERLITLTTKLTVWVHSFTTYSFNIFYLILEKKLRLVKGEPNTFRFQSSAPVQHDSFSVQLVAVLYNKIAFAIWSYKNYVSFEAPSFIQRNLTPFHLFPVTSNANSKLDLKETLSNKYNFIWPPPAACAGVLCAIDNKLRTYLCIKENVTPRYTSYNSVFQKGRQKLKLTVRALDA